MQILWGFKKQECQTRQLYPIKKTKNRKKGLLFYLQNDHHVIIWHFVLIQLFIYWILFIFFQVVISLLKCSHFSSVNPSAFCTYFDACSTRLTSWNRRPVKRAIPKYTSFVVRTETTPVSNRGFVVFCKSVSRQLQFSNPNWKVFHSQRKNSSFLPAFESIQNQ